MANPILGIVLPGDATTDHDQFNSSLRPRFRVEGEFCPGDIAEAAQALIDLLDGWAPDPDLEDDDPPEHDGADRDTAWIEWPTMRASQKRGPNIAGDHEDDEDDGDRDDGQFSEDEPAACFATMKRGPGCISSDADTEHDGREDMW